MEMLKEDCVYLAKLAELVERYDDMASSLQKRIVESRNELSVEERNLLDDAYKNVIDSRRRARRVISHMGTREVSRNNEGLVALVKDYQSRIESEISDICAGILNLLDSHLIPYAASSESKVLYLRMKGDYRRYLAELKDGLEWKEAAEDTRLAYKAAQDVALADLAPTHPIRLGLALNFSVFYYTTVNLAEEACAMAKQAYEEAIAELDTLGEESYNDDTTIIMQLLEDNLTLWTFDMQEQLDEA